MMFAVCKVLRFQCKIVPLYVINIILFGTSLYLFINWYKLREIVLELILSIFLIEFAAEIAVFFLNRYQFSNGSSWVYNFSLPVECILYGFLFSKVFRSRLVRKLILGASVLVFFPLFINLFWDNSFYKFNTLLYGYVCLFILACTISFFIGLAVKDYFYINPLKQFYFWVSSGLLICYLGGFMLLTNAFSLIQKDRILYLDLKQVNLFLNIFLCLSIIIATECLKKYRAFQIRSL